MEGSFYHHKLHDMGEIDVGFLLILLSQTDYGKLKMPDSWLFSLLLFKKN